MAGSSSVKINLNEQANKILEAAQKSGLEQNFLFVTTFKRYQVQLKCCLTWSGNLTIPAY